MGQACYTIRSLKETLLYFSLLHAAWNLWGARQVSPVPTTSPMSPWRKLSFLTTAATAATAAWRPAAAFSLTSQSSVQLLCSAGASSAIGVSRYRYPVPVAEFLILKWDEQVCPVANTRFKYLFPKPRIFLYIYLKVTVIRILHSKNFSFLYYWHTVCV